MSLLLKIDIGKKFFHRYWPYIERDDKFWKNLTKSGKKRPGQFKVLDGWGTLILEEKQKKSAK